MKTEIDYEKLLETTRAEIIEQLEEHLKDNRELREFFEKYPERKSMYVDKILDSGPLY